MVLQASANGDSWRSDARRARIRHPNLGRNGRFDDLQGEFIETDVDWAMVVSGDDHRIGTLPHFW